MSEDEYVPPPTTLSLSRSAGAGIAALGIGCTLLASACVLMVFNVTLFERGFGGIPRGLSLVGGVIGVGGVTLLGLVAVILGARSWATAGKSGESSALGFGAFAAGLVGLIAWIIAGTSLMMVLLT